MTKMTMREGSGRLREMERLISWSKSKPQGFDKERSLASIKSERRHDKSKSKALAKSKKGSAFERQQKLISKERSEYAKKYPGTYKGRPIHELRKEAMLD